MLVVNSHGSAGFSEWQDLFEAEGSLLEVRDWYDPTVDPLRVKYAMVWQPDHGRLRRFENLSVIISQAAGVDHLLADPDLPKHVPITRMITDETAMRMADFVMMATYAVIRDVPSLSAHQAARQWNRELVGRIACETTVGVLGVGSLGRPVCERLLANGFRVRGWSRSGRHIEGMHSHVGHLELDSFLRSSDVVVNLLPNTSDTHGLINESFLRRMKAGSSLINVGRGTHLVEADLLSMLDASHIRSAVLDVFNEEPLSQDNRLWSHPSVMITPHIASITSRRAKVKQALEVIQCYERGSALPHIYDCALGY